MIYPALALLLLSLRAAAQDSSTSTVSAAFASASIVPDVIPSFNPVFPILVTFTDDSGNTVEVTAGMELTINQTANMPSFAIVSTNSQIFGKPYLIAIVDPDAPTPTNTSVSQVRHFLGENYVGNAVVNGTIPLTNMSALLSTFMGPQPPPGSPAHRYTVLMYLTPGSTVTPPSGFDPNQKLNFNISQFVDDIGGLTLVGGTFFKVAPDSSNGSSASSAGGSPATTSSGAAPAGTSPSAGTRVVATWGVQAILTALGIAMVV